VARAKRTVAKRAAAREAAGRASDRVVATNRRARHDFDVLETYEAGIVLRGSEVKSLREGKAQLADAYARVSQGEVWLYGMHIPPWQFATGFGAHDPDRRRKLLLHRKEIDQLMGKTTQQALTLIPLSLYFKDGRAKVSLALARGRKLHDKRQALAERDAKRELSRAAREAAKVS
jgi:SsrA-binding protein